MPAAAAAVSGSSQAPKKTGKRFQAPRPKKGKGKSKAQKGIAEAAATSKPTESKSDSEPQWDMFSELADGAVTATSTHPHRMVENFIKDRVGDKFVCAST